MKKISLFLVFMSSSSLLSMSQGSFSPGFKEFRTLVRRYQDYILIGVRTPLLFGIPHSSPDKQVLEKINMISAISEQDIVDGLALVNDYNLYSLMYKLMLLWQDGINLSLRNTYFFEDKNIWHIVFVRYMHLLSKNEQTEKSISNITSYTNIFTFFCEHFKDQINPNEVIDTRGNTYFSKIVEETSWNLIYPNAFSHMHGMLIYFLKIFHQKTDPSIKNTYGNTAFDICNPQDDWLPTMRNNRAKMLATLTHYFPHHKNFPKQLPLCKKSHNCFFILNNAHDIFLFS